MVILAFYLTFSILNHVIHLNVCVSAYFSCHLQKKYKEMLQVLHFLAQDNTYNINIIRFILCNE